MLHGAHSISRREGCISVPFLASRDPVRNVAIIDARSLWACAYSPLRPCCLENLSRAPRLGAVGDTTCTSLAKLLMIRGSQRIMKMCRRGINHLRLFSRELAAFLYLLRPRETHWKPAGKFLKDNYLGVFTVFAGRCRGFCFDIGLQIEIQVELIWNRSQVDCG